jgi:hypothetical protein
MKFFIQYKGYVIADASKSGGKAGRGKNSTSTIQVRDPLSTGGYLLHHHFRYKVDSTESRERAVAKAHSWVDGLQPTKL